EAVKGFGFVANRRIRIRRPEHINHCLSRRFRESLFSLSARPFLRAALATQHNCRHENDEDDHWMSSSGSHGLTALLYCKCHAIRETTSQVARMLRLTFVALLYGAG